MAGPGWSVQEIDNQMLEVLPPRETLFFDIDIVNVIGVNLAIAVNAASMDATTVALAFQQLTANS